MHNKIGPRIIIAAFIVIICFPWLFWGLLEQFIDSENYENRELASKPRLTVENYKSFPEEYNNYYNDNIPFRNNLITINTAIDYFVFGKSTSDNVIIGKNNWLFYSRNDDGDPIGCYQGTNLITDEQLQAIAQNCIKQKDFLAEQGKEFIIFVAPNKERINYEYMPQKYGMPADNYQALQIIEYLKNNTDVRIVYPYDELINAKNILSQNIWYKMDTHWNYIGGYIGAAALLKELGIELPNIDSKQITITTGENTSGDLASMLNLTEQLKFADYEYSVSGYDNHNAQVIEKDFNTVFSYQAQNADSRSIYVIRDSFSTHMADYIGAQFDKSYFRHRNTYTFDDFVSQDPDIVVYETVERYISGLSSFSIQ